MEAPSSPSPTHPSVVRPPPGPLRREPRVALRPPLQPVVRRAVELARGDDGRLQYLPLPPPRGALLEPRYCALELCVGGCQLPGARLSRLSAAVAILERGGFVVRGAGGALLCGDEEEDVTEDIIRDSFSHGAVAVLGRRAPAPEGASDLLHRRFLTQLGAQSFHMAGPQGGVIARFRGGPRPR
jgi:hypothetical protein